MTISAYDRASRILVELRQCLLGPLPQGSSEEKCCNKKIKELYDELHIICRKTHTEFFLYVYKSFGFELEEGTVIVLNTIKNARIMYSEVEIVYGCIENPTYTWKQALMDMENILISQAGEWLGANKEYLSDIQMTVAPPQETQLPENPTRRETNTFRQAGDFWEIVYKRDSLPPIRDLDGFHYIHQTLYNSSKRFKALEIYQQVKGNTHIIEAGEYEDGLSISPTPTSRRQQIMDSLSTKAIKRAIEECKGKIEEANAEGNIEAKEDLEKKLQELRKHLSSGAGLANKPRKFPDDNERARKTVRKAIDKALEEIKKYNEELYDHLNKSIIKGARVYYSPIEPTVWE